MKHQSAFMALLKNTLASLVSLLPSVSPPTPNCILKVISYSFSLVQSTSVARGCWCVTCLGWGSASLGHSHSPELRPTGKLINTQASCNGLVLSSPAQPHICLCLGPRSPYIPTHLGSITASMFEEIPSPGLPRQAIQEKHRL